MKKENVLGDNIGFIELVDSLGNDLTIVNSARVSFGARSDWVYEERDVYDESTREIHTYREPVGLKDKDKKLIKYLAKNKHFSPFRHLQLQFHVKMPEMIARQMFKHIVGADYTFKDTAWNELCLSGDSMITFVSNGKKLSPVKYNLAELYDKYNSKPEWFSNKNIRCLDAEKGKFTTSKVKSVMKRGVLGVYRIDVDGGYSIECTSNHRIWTNQGWMTLSDFATIDKKTIAYNKNILIGTNGYRVVGNGKYRDKEWMKEQRKLGKSVQEIADAAGCSYPNIRKWLKIHDLRFDPKDTHFKHGSEPWNKGLTYSAARREFSEEALANIRKARSGAASNFWKGGVTSKRRHISRWTIEQGPKVHEKFDYTCQICGARGGKLNSHHIIPVWADESLAKDFNNLVSLCEVCHKKLHAEDREIEWANNYLGGNAIDAEVMTEKPRARKRFLQVSYKKINSISYVGEKECFDIEVDGRHDNFVANNIVVHNSGRYKVMGDEFYVPKEFRAQSKDNKQASDGLVGDQDLAWRRYQEGLQHAYVAYQDLIDMGVAKEQARGLLPVSFYTEFFWTASLQAVVNFIQLRLHEHAQHEIQKYAAAMKELTMEVAPEGLSALLGEENEQQI